MPLSLVRYTDVHSGARHMSKHPHRVSGFTLIELLVVISIIVLLIGILLPVLGSSRREARAIKCGSNMRQIVTAMTGYSAENDDYYPPSYVYPDDAYSGGTGYSWSTPPNIIGSTNDINGYVHWSFALMSNKTIETDAFQCPEFQNDGLPPTNPTSEIQALFPDMTPGGGGGVVDRQAELCSYTANEVIVPRNKFGSAPNVRANQLVRAGHVRKPAGTIMVTEFIDNIYVVSDSSGIPKTHRSINPVVGAGVTETWVGTTLNTPMVDIGPSVDWLLSPWDDLRNSTSSSTTQPLNMVGRHHPGGSKELGGEGTTNFSRVDGSTFRATLIETLRDREWGDKYYSLTGQPQIRFTSP